MPDFDFNQPTVPIPPSPPTVVENNNTISPYALEQLRKTHPWLMFISIMGFIFSGFSFIAGIFMAVSGTAISKYSNSAVMPIIVFFVYSLLGTIYLIISWFLFQYAKNLKLYCAGNDSHFLDMAFNKQRVYWLIIGIIVILFIAIYALLILFLIIALIAKG